MRRLAAIAVVAVVLGGCAQEPRRYPGLERAFQTGWTVQEEQPTCCREDGLGEPRGVVRFTSPDGSSHLLGDGH